VAFEGSEKRLEVLIDPKACADLRMLGRGFWQDVVQHSQATILSEIASETCIAYLLSESSLFVWPNRFTLITCGQTQLIDAALHFFQMRTAWAQAVLYQRKNERFPQMQRSDCREDARRLSDLFDGQIITFGQHFNPLFYYERASTPDGVHTGTAQLLMVDLRRPVERLFGFSVSQTQLKEQFAETNLYTYFKVDDHVFEPCGYSVNGLRGDHYFTIHVTPEPESSYASFETNLDLSQFDPALFKKLLQIFQPTTFDIVLFQPRHPNQDNLQGYPLSDFRRRKLGPSHEVCVLHHTDS